jgi:hypothetical protein
MKAEYHAAFIEKMIHFVAVDDLLTAACPNNDQGDLHVCWNLLPVTTASLWNPYMCHTVLPQCIDFAVYHLGIRGFGSGLPVLFILGFFDLAILFIIFFAGVRKNDAVQTSDLEMNKCQPSLLFHG